MSEIKAWLRERSKKDATLYERYGKPLEADHKGEFVAIGDDGVTIIGRDSIQLDLRALERFGSGNYALRRIGYAVEGKWRRTA